MKYFSKLSLNKIQSEINSRVNLRNVWIFNKNSLIIAHENLRFKAKKRDCEMCNYES